MTKNVALKLRAVRALLARLTPARRAYWSKLLWERENKEAAAVGSSLEFVKQQAPTEDVEWDLASANWLDRVYTAVSDEATRVRKEGTAALADTSSAIGWGLWPLAIAALAIGLAVRMGRGK